VVTYMATRNKIKNSEWAFDAGVYALLSFALAISVYPIIFVISASISDPYMVNTGQVLLWPRGLSLEGYSQVLKYRAVFIGYRNTIFYTVFGTALKISVTMAAAFALSRKDLFGRNALTLFMAFTMWFSGGLIPTFILVNNLGLVNKPYTLIILGAVSMWNTIIARTFIQSSIPMELQESAHIDGCSDFRIFFSIIIPLSVPVIAVISLFYAVEHWNGYFQALIYISDAELQPLQIILRQILIMNQTVDMLTTDEMIDIAYRARLAMTMKYSLVVIASLPMLIFYPFVQRYFIKGLMIGAIKG
jgi:putative aldouronate transport system permease protein